MKVIYIVNDLDFFLSHRIALATNAVKRGYEVYIVSDKIVDIGHPNIHLIKIRIQRSSTGIFNNLKTIRDLFSVIKRIEPTLIHNVTLKPILYTNLLLLFNKKIKVVNAISGLGFLFTFNIKSKARIFTESLFRLIIRVKKPYFIFQNEVDENQFKKLGLKNDQRVIIKGSGVDAHLFDYTAPNKNEVIEVVFTGRILIDKGLIEFIEAAKLLKEEYHKRVKFSIYGKIDLENPAHITEEDLLVQMDKDYITWHDYTNDVKSVLKRADIYCLPSYREGLPKSIVEAMAIGRPILTTSAPGCDDTVEEGFNGFKVPVGDVTHLSEALKLLIDDDNLRLQLGKNSRELFEKEFTLEQIVEQTFDFYEEILNP
jgi:glycosyltransferase involved in cell wall biosynthesis